MLKELMLPAEVKLLKPNPAGCWHCVAAMMHGLLALCGPRLFPCIGPVSVSRTAEAVPVSANIAAVAAKPIHASRPLRHMTRSPARTVIGWSALSRATIALLILSISALVRRGRFIGH